MFSILFEQFEKAVIFIIKPSKTLHIYLIHITIDKHFFLYVYVSFNIDFQNKHSVFAPVWSQSKWPTEQNLIAWIKVWQGAFLKEVGYFFLVD